MPQSMGSQRVDTAEQLNNDNSDSYADNPGHAHTYRECRMILYLDRIQYICFNLFTTFMYSKMEITNEHIL